MRCGSLYPARGLTLLRERGWEKREREANMPRDEGIWRNKEKCDSAEARPQHFCLYEIMYSAGLRHISQSITSSLCFSLSLILAYHFCLLYHIPPPPLPPLEELSLCLISRNPSLSAASLSSSLSQMCTFALCPLLLQILLFHRRRVFL